MTSQNKTNHVIALYKQVRPHYLTLLIMPHHFEPCLKFSICILAFIATFSTIPALASELPRPIIDLTQQEKAYIEKVGSIKMCVDPDSDWMPFERINDQGQHEGIAADLVQLVAQRVGLQIELYSVKNWDESLAASKASSAKL